MIEPNISCVSVILPNDDVYKFSVASSLNELKIGNTMAEILNTSSEKIVIHKGQKIGHFSETCWVVGTENNSEEHSMEIPLDHSDLSTEEKRIVKERLGQYSDAIGVDDNDLGFCETVKHHINVEGAAPIKQKYRRLHNPIKKEVEGEIQRMLRNGIIEKSNSPWCSPLIPVRKKSGGIRICVDYRALNAVTKQDSFPLPNIEDSISQFSGNCYFSTLDLISGYHQIALGDDSRELTAFSTESGLYQYRVMPMGATGSPATFQRLMNVLLSGIPTEQAQAYLDDLLVGGKSFEDHLNNLEMVLNRLRDHGLKLNLSKCKFFHREAEYLGHIVSAGGVKPSRTNVKAILDFPQPRTVRQVKRFNGMVNYYRKFIPEAATIMKPLYDVTTLRSLKWTELCEEAFNKVKELLVSPAVLGYPEFDSNEPMIVTVDGSNDGAGATLSQSQAGNERVLGFASTAFNKSQRGYSATEKELAAMRFAVNHFRHYLYGRDFVIRTDHRALVYLNKMKLVNDRLLRTAEELNIGRFVIEHLPGKDNVVADCLSRALIDCEDSNEINNCNHLPTDAVVVEVAGGPDSLFRAILLALGKDSDRETLVEIRESCVDQILSNLRRYGFKNTKDSLREIELMRREDTFVGTNIMQACADKFKVNISLLSRSLPRIEFATNDAQNKIALECRGGMHFNT